MLTPTSLMPEVAEIRAIVCHDRLTQLFRRVSERAGQMRCGITGHNVLLRYQPTRLSLRDLRIRVAWVGAWPRTRDARVFRPALVATGDGVITAATASM